MTLWIIGPQSGVRSALVAASAGFEQEPAVQDDVPLQSGYLQQDAITLSRAHVAKQSVAELGIARDDPVIALLGLLQEPSPGYLPAAAAALIATGARRIVWVNRLGVGFSKRKVHGAAHWILNKRFGASVDDRLDSDALILDAGQTVFHVHAPSRLAGDRATCAQPFVESGRSFPRRRSPADVARMSLELATGRALPGIYLAR